MTKELVISDAQIALNLLCDAENMLEGVYGRGQVSEVFLKRNVLGKLRTLMYHLERAIDDLQEE